MGSSPIISSSFFRAAEARVAGILDCSGRGSVCCGSNSVVESQPSKLLVAGSIPVSRSKFTSIEGQ